MATNVNRTELIGNLGNDPETRYTPTGSLMTTASIAVHSSFKQGEEWKERTDWFRLVAFGERAEHLNRFGKGERIQVTGRLQTSDYTDREGQRRTSVEVVVLRSDPAPLPRKAQAVSEPPDAGEESTEAPPFDPAAEPPVRKTRRRKQASA